uniref:Uncharacterized protein n=1 Tax=Caenorhabditis tropicalis TaxID=1561998 RepID=A0A1I7U5I3_9PELO
MTISFVLLLILSNLVEISHSADIDFALICDKGYRVSSIKRAKTAYSLLGSLTVECEQIALGETTNCAPQQSVPKCTGLLEGCTGNTWLGGFHVYLLENTTQAAVLDPVCCSSPSVQIDSGSCINDQLNTGTRDFSHSIVADLVYRGWQCWHQYDRKRTLVDLLWKTEICPFTSSDFPVITRKTDCEECSCECGIEQCSNGSSPAAEKGEKLVAEIDQIGEEYVVVQDDFKINDELDLRENLTTVVAAVVSTTEKTTDKEVEGGGDEHEESDPEEPRPHNDNEFGEFGDSKASHVEEPSEAPPLNFADHHIEIPSNSEHSESEDPAKNEEISETPPPKDPVENRQKIENNESHVAEVPPTKYMAEDLSKIQKIESHVDSDPLKFVAATAEVPSGSPEESSPKNQLEVITSKIEEKTDDEWISWDLLHFLLLLSPYDENEVTWWTMIFEAVRVSELRSGRGLF